MTFNSFPDSSGASMEDIFRHMIQIFQFLSGFQLIHCGVCDNLIKLFQFLSGFQLIVPIVRRLKELLKLSIPFRIPGSDASRWRSSKSWRNFQFLSGFQATIFAAKIATALVTGFQFLSGFQRSTKLAVLVTNVNALSIPFRIPATQIIA